MTPILGVDVYSGYGLINWGLVAQAGYRFAFIKCTEGNEPARNDSAFMRNVADAKAAGLFVGAYHFPYPLQQGPVFANGSELHPGRSPEQQAKRAYDASYGLGSEPGELPHVCDAEWPEIGDWGKWNLTAPLISEWLKRYCECATELWGRKPLIYTYPFWWRAVAASADVSWAAEYGLWLASYNHGGEGPPLTPPKLIAPWTSLGFHQFSAKGSAVRIPGISACPVDRDVFWGTEDELRRLANIDPDADTQPEVVPSVRPNPLESRTVTDLSEAMADMVARHRLEREDPPDDAA